MFEVENSLNSLCVKVIVYSKVFNDDGNTEFFIINDNIDLITSLNFITHEFEVGHEYWKMWPTTFPTKHLIV